METTFRSVLELVRHDPSAIVDDSSFDKIIDTLNEVCKENGNFLSGLFQSVPSMIETIQQLAVSASSKAASFGMRLLGLCIRYQRLPYQRYTSLLKQSVCSMAPNIVCAVLGVLKIIVVEHDGIDWIMEERIHILILNKLNSLSYFVASMAKDVVCQLIVICVENVVKEQSEIKGLCKACLDDLHAHLNVEFNDNRPLNIGLFSTVMRLASHMVETSLPPEVFKYLFTNFWSLDKWWDRVATFQAKQSQLMLSFFETCINNGRTNLLEETIDDDSFVLGHVASLCERDMTLDAMGLLRVAISLRSPSSKATNMQKCENLCKLSMYPLMVYLKDDGTSLPRGGHTKLVVMAIRQQVLENTEHILLLSLKNVNCIVKGYFDSDSSLAVDLCVTLLEACSGTNSLPVVGSLSSAGRNKIITELLIILSQVFGDSPNHLTSQSSTERLAGCLAELVQKRSFPLQVACKCLNLIGQVVTTLLKLTNVDSVSRCGLLSRIAESLQLCAMDVNWEIRDSYMELIGSLATKQVSAAVVQFLTKNKLCELLATHGLADNESCVKASAMLALASIMTTPQLVEIFSKSGQLGIQVDMADSILGNTDPNSHDAIVRIAAWRAFHIIYKNSQICTNSGVIIEKLAKFLPLNITDDNWEIKLEVVEMLMLLYQSLYKQSSTLKYALGCNGVSDTHCELLTAINFFEVLKEGITDYNSLVKEKAKVVVDLLETSLKSGHKEYAAHLVELIRLRDSACIAVEKKPSEILLDVLQEILMAAKSEESELKLTDCY